ncbi:hypothetical protein [Neptuniibacter marinus]|uniref:hypothetical protein n=1 Tax=Neptuniibacter marinus TaxID=1806670 RepID=UPI003B5A91DC
MQLTRCPVCHSRISLEQLVQDEAGRDLLTLLTRLDKSTGTVLVTYIGLFRSQSRDLANNRALKLAQDTLALAAEPQLLTAMANVVESMRAKQQQGSFKPLSNHNYLKRVLETTDAIMIEPLPQEVTASNKQTKRAAISAAVMDIADIDWTLSGN